MKTNQPSIFCVLLLLFIFSQISLSAFPIEILIEDEKENFEIHFLEKGTLKRGKKTWNLNKGEILKGEIIQSKPGEIRYYVGLEIIDFNQPQKVKEREQFYRDLKLPLMKTRILGAPLFNKKKQINDNRQYFILSEFTLDELETKKKIDILAGKGIQAFLLRELIRLGKTQFSLTRGKKKVPFHFEGGKLSLFSKGEIKIKKVSFGKGYQWGGKTDRQYQGPLSVFIDGKGLFAISVQKDLEEYLKGVVPSEMPHTAPLEALKAQSVCARGDILTKIGRHHVGEPYQVCSEVHCQVYSGDEKTQPSTNQAIKETRGLIMLSDQGIAESLYSACCGGSTENNERVWRSPPRSHLRGKLDRLDPTLQPPFANEDQFKKFIDQPPEVYCGDPSVKKEGIFRWEKTLSNQEIQSLLKERKEIGPVKSITINGRGEGGKVSSLTLVGEKGELTIQRELPIRQAFGNLKSGLFYLEKNEKKGSPFPESFTFKGGGWGHGVGMCQRGAMGMGHLKIPFKKILHHYFTSTRLFQLK